MDEDGKSDEKVRNSFRQMWPNRLGKVCATHGKTIFKMILTAKYNGRSSRFRLGT